MDERLKAPKKVIVWFANSAHLHIIETRVRLRRHCGELRPAVGRENLDQVIISILLTFAGLSDAAREASTSTGALCRARGLLFFRVFVPRL